MDDASEKILPICNCLQSIMIVNDIDKAVKHIKKSMKQKYRSNP